ncbi:atp-dependent rna helicase a [Nannochloropsis gaditana]|uniref:Atp-dependent rna helicase a n=1 Tax=Nannochloropsis gaditana TaxID=72520 RepID=W7T0X5_9STRA|nr:atp-dependent rna helicase a [Nannochloropsis gaditana]
MKRADADMDDLLPSFPVHASGQGEDWEEEEEEEGEAGGGEEGGKEGQLLLPRMDRLPEASKALGNVRLPILDRKEEIVRAIATHPVVIIEGETGCGKSTQVPKFIIQADPLARLAITTPTRKAATNLAKEVARQLGEDVGRTVGYRIGNDRSADKDRARILFVTAGWLLQKLVHSQGRALYSHVLLDEVHERSIESDLLCFILRDRLSAASSSGQAAPKLILMSATLQSSIFQDYFHPALLGSSPPPSSSSSDALSHLVSCERTGNGGIPGRESTKEGTGTSGVGRAGFYEKEEEWREGGKEEDDDEEKDEEVPTLHVGAKSPFSVTEVYLEDLRGFCAFLEADLALSCFVDSMVKRGESMAGSKPALEEKMMTIAVKLLSSLVAPGQVALVFVAGMADIEDLHTHFSDLLPPHKLASLEILPFHSLISVEETDKVFEPSPTRSKIIIATNIAEASLTINDVKFVVDFGVAKALRYDILEHRTVLGYSWVSQASANQRRGRTGRVCDGFVIRLYTRAFFASLSPHDEPEILTKPLDAVILQMKIMEFPDPIQALMRCITPPEVEQVTAATGYLFEIGALEANDATSPTTALGPLLNTLGVDLPIARMMILGCVLGVGLEAIVMAASLCLPQDVFRLPHPTFSKSIPAFFHEMGRVQFYKEAYSYGLASDPLTTLVVFSAFLRMVQDTSSSLAASSVGPTTVRGKRELKKRQRDWCTERGLVSRTLDRLHMVVKDLSRKLSLHSDGSLPTFEEVHKTLVRPTYVQELLRDQEKIFLLRSLLLGSFHANLLRGTMSARGNSEEDDRKLVIRRPPAEIIRCTSLGDILGMEEDMSKIQSTKNGRDLEVLFLPADLRAGRRDTEASSALPSSTMPSPDAVSASPLAPFPPFGPGQHGFRDVHFAVKALLNSKTGLSLKVENPTLGAAKHEEEDGDEEEEEEEEEGARGGKKKRRGTLGSQTKEKGNARLLELDVIGKYAMQWKCLKMDVRVGFPKASILRNAAVSCTALSKLPSSSSPAPGPSVLYAVTPQISKFLSREQIPFYSAPRATLLPFPESLLAVLIAVFSRNEVISFRHLRSDAEEVIAEMLEGEAEEGEEVRKEGGNGGGRRGGQGGLRNGSYRESGGTSRELASRRREGGSGSPTLASSPSTCYESSTTSVAPYPRLLRGKDG